MPGFLASDASVTGVGLPDIRKTFHHRVTETQRKQIQKEELVYDIGVEHAVLLQIM
jgi:hypothetical protein